MALYISTDGDNWTDNTNWLVTYIPSDWFGVTVSSGHVSNIFLWNNNLTGTIPPELGNLKELAWLSLDENQLTGSIPAELGNLTALEGLGLTSNQLTGSIPSELGNMTAMQELYLFKNQITGTIPPKLGNLAEVRKLELYENQITGTIPPELGKLTALQGLSLNSNQLTGSIPPELGNLTALLDINLTANQLSGSIPLELGNLTALEELYFYENQLSGTIPAELGNLTALQVLGLAGNQLSGTIPAELVNLTALLNLDLSSNILTGIIPPELGNLTALQSLGLAGNQLSGNIPSELGNLTALQFLFLQFNPLTGSIPSSFVNLSVLDTFYFQGTNLCEPTTPEYLEWKETVLEYQGTGVSCILPPLEPTKTAAGSYDRTITWTLDKSADPDGHTGIPGDTFYSDWIVDVTKTEVENNFKVTGSITINNPAGIAQSFTVADVLNDGTVATVDCDIYTIPAGGTAYCTYEALPADGSAIMNTATVSAPGNPDQSATAAVSFTANVIGDETTTLTDVEGPLYELLNGDYFRLYSRTFACSSNPDDYTNGVDVDIYSNIATLSGDNTNLTDQATVTVTCVYVQKPNIKIENVKVLSAAKGSDTVTGSFVVKNMSDGNVTFVTIDNVTVAFTSKAPRGVSTQHTAVCTFTPEANRYVLAPHEATLFAYTCTLTPAVPSNATELTAKVTVGTATNIAGEVRGPFSATSRTFKFK